MSLTKPACVIALMCFPRVSGDEPPLWGGLYYLEEFSPRERG